MTAAHQIHHLIVEGCGVTQQFFFRLRAMLRLKFPLSPAKIVSEIAKDAFEERNINFNVTIHRPMAEVPRECC